MSYEQQDLYHVQGVLERTEDLLIFLGYVEDNFVLDKSHNF